MGVKEMTNAEYLAWRHRAGAKASAESVSSADPLVSKPGFQKVRPVPPPELLVATGWRGRGRVWVLARVPGTQPHEMLSAGAAIRPAELFSLAFSILGLGFQAIRGQSRRPHQSPVHQPSRDQSLL